MAKLTKTKTPGIFRRHKAGCDGQGRCECSYVVVWRHRGKQHTATFPTYALAREAQGERLSGERRPVSRVKFGEYFSEWIESYQGRTSRGFSETTRPEYRRPIKQHAVPRWGDWKLSEIEPTDVRDLFGRMRREGASASQVKKLRAALSALFATAVEDGLVKANPCQGVRVPAGDSEEPAEDRVKALTREQLRLLLAAVTEEGYWRLFVEFLAVSGLRIGEAVGLRWKYLDLGDRPHVKVREQVYRGERRRLKSRHARRDVPLSPSMRDRLLEHRRDHFTGPDSPVFPSTTGTPLSPANVFNRVLSPAAIACGLYVEVEGADGRTRKRSAVTPHVLRHTCASLLFEEGRNVKQVQEWLGHADPGFTLRTYIHLLDAGLGEGLDLEPRVNSGSTQRPQSPVEAGHP